ncbi:MAG TPA: hypothetical protein VFF06_00750 [Polyangia bacterium]|nr:hypothetical protein [Polyangia bacterium]
MAVAIGCTSAGPPSVATHTQGIISSDGGTDDGGASCTCTGTGANGPVVVNCGDTTCGEDGNTYACNDSMWSFSAAGCGPAPDGGASSCTCTGSGAGGPVTVNCGDTTCGEDGNTYACDASGWSFSAAGCGAAPDGGATSGCTCTGTGANGPVVVNCGDTTCGEDGNTYACNASMWSFSAAGCGPAAPDGGTSSGCTCSGTNASGPVTVNCGDTTCGEDGNTYACDASGWSFSAAGCLGSCTCSGTGANGPVTVNCGDTTCGTDGNTYACNNSMWSFSAEGCSASCTCSGTGASGPVTVNCGDTTCGTDNNLYACSASGWSSTGTSCP